LNLPDSIVKLLRRNLISTDGGILIVGPAGSGKTTTAYACLREIVRASVSARSIASLEDPIETTVDGVAQSQVSSTTGFDMATGLRSLLRLDPEVILIGEMRDRTTAEIALQAALTGQLVITTFHAGNCQEARERLVQMGIPKFASDSAIRLIIAQRLVRRLCSCARPADPQETAVPLGLAVSRCWIAAGCDRCFHTGYSGRSLIAEAWPSQGATPASQSGDHADTAAELWESAAALVEAGVTTPHEVVRVLGWR
jgi:type II secretory ATPase GspE/PulE/Tfp pilus assembly ATPase PilB-like protein